MRCVLTLIDSLISCHIVRDAQRMVPRQRSGLLTSASCNPPLRGVCDCLSYTKKRFQNNMGRDRNGRGSFEDVSLEGTKAARLRVLHIILFRLDDDFKLKEKPGTAAEEADGRSGVRSSNGCALGVAVSRWLQKPSNFQRSKQKSSECQGRLLLATTETGT